MTLINILLNYLKKSIFEFLLLIMFARLATEAKNEESAKDYFAIALLAWKSSYSIQLASKRGL